MKISFALEIYNELFYNYHDCKFYIAGSIRREKEEVRDIDVVCVGKTLPTFSNVTYLAQGAKINRFLYKDVQIDLYLADENNYESMLLFLTGSQAFNKKMRFVAKSKKYKLSQYGLFDKDNNLLSNKEKEIFNLLNITYVNPNKR